MRKCFRMYKNIAVGAALLIGVAVGTVYFMYFRHPPAEDIMAANMRRTLSTDGKKAERHHVKCSKNDDDDDDDCYEDDEDYDDTDGAENVDDIKDPVKASRLQWERFIAKNKFVDIGTLYNKCEGDDKVTLGKVILLPEKGGVKTRTFLNYTLEKEMTGGEMYVITHYKGRELYNNHWPFCISEEGMPDRIIYCPIKPQKHSYFRDLPIPSYLPKGTFTTKCWVTNQDKEMMGCSFSEFTI